MTLTSTSPWPDQVDAQGLDLDIMRSGGRRLHLVERFSLEVVADDCTPIYSRQTTCSDVVNVAASLGYTPASPFNCRFPQGWRLKGRRGQPLGAEATLRHSFCEMDILFVRQGVDPEPMHYGEYHRPGPHACTQLYTSNEESLRWQRHSRPPAGSLMIVNNRGGRGQMYLGDAYEGRQSPTLLGTSSVKVAHAVAVWCPADCFTTQLAADAETLAAHDAAHDTNVTRYGGKCAW